MKAFGRKARRGTLAAGAAVVASAGSADAVVITGSPGTVLPTDGSALDINIDGVGPDEFFVQFVPVKGGKGGKAIKGGKEFFIAAFTDTLKAKGKGKGPTKQPLGRITPDPVEPGSFVQNGIGFDVNTTVDGPNFESEGSSLFFGIQFRNMAGADFLNGWIELVLEKAGMKGGGKAPTVFPTVVFENFAFETKAGKAIQVPGAVSEVPLPASGPLALLGLAGLSLWRRRRGK
ncbi:MAG: hypothetical protein AAGE90_09390 [Pseudomonadota bacterium]